MPEDVKVPPGYTLEEDIKLPPGYTLEGGTPARDRLDDPDNKLLGTSNGIPVYAAPPVSIPLRNSAGPVTPAPDKPLTGVENALLSPLEFLKGGMEQLGQGLHGVAHPESAEQMAGSASDVIRGGLQTATPFLLPEMIAHPLATLAGLGTFGAADAAVETAGHKLGLPDGYVRLAGDLIGMYGGTKIHRWLSDMAKIPDRRVADSIYQKLEAAVERLKDPALPAGDRAAVKASIDALLVSPAAGGGMEDPRNVPDPQQAEADAYHNMPRDVGVAPKAGAPTGNLFGAGGSWAPRHEPRPAP